MDAFSENWSKSQLSKKAVVLKYYENLTVTTLSGNDLIRVC